MPCPFGYTAQDDAENSVSTNSGKKGLTKAGASEGAPDVVDGAVNTKTRVSVRTYINVCVLAVLTNPPS
eukprot:356968-Chlamydomonas_euryale.AAC.14